MSLPETKVQGEAEYVRIGSEGMCRNSEEEARHVVDLVMDTRKLLVASKSCISDSQKRSCIARSKAERTKAVYNQRFRFRTLYFVPVLCCSTVRPQHYHVGTLTTKLIRVLAMQLQ